MSLISSSLKRGTFPPSFNGPRLMSHSCYEGVVGDGGIYVTSSSWDVMICINVAAFTICMPL